MAQEAAKEKSGGVAYEVILKPAQTESAPRPPSPPKERPISQEVIEKKLKEAEERRQSMEQAKLALVAKDKARIAEANQKIQGLNESFSKETEKKLQEKLEASAEKKNQQIKALQERLRDHAKRVETVRQTCDMYADDQRREIMNRFEKRMNTMQQNKSTQLKKLQERLSDHEKRIGEVLEASTKFSKVTEEKIIQKMETTLKNREGQLQNLMTRLAEHDKHAQEVREKALNLSAVEPEEAEATS